MALCPTPDSVFGVRVQGELAFLAAGKSGVHIVDVSDPYAPVLISTVPDTPGAWDCHLDGSTASVPSETFGGVYIVDISDLHEPFVVSRFHDGGESNAVTGNGSVVFVADNVDGVEVLDISDVLAAR